MSPRDETDLFLDKVFNLSPVTRRDSYIASAVAQTRRSLNDHGLHTMPPASYDLPKWLRPETLGPYETRLLASLLYSPGPIIVLRGGTGSGKSSVLGHLCQHATAALKEVERAELPIFCGQMLIQIDLQTFPIKAHKVLDDSDTIDVSELLKSISDSLFAALGRTVKNDDDTGRILLDALCAEDEETMGIRHAVMYEVRQNCDPTPESWQTLSGTERFQAFRVATKTLPPGSQLVAALCVFRTLHRLLNKGRGEDSEWPIVIVLDNIDPLPPPYQSELLRTLSQITSGDSWGNMRVVLSMRLSTYEQHIGALRFNHYEHDAADPAEIVFVRTTIALLVPEAYPAFKTLKPQLQELAYATLLRLFGHLVDRGGHFSSVLSAMTGTNIRHALTHAHRWCVALSAKAGGETRGQRQAFQSWLRSALCRHYLDELGTRLEREVHTYLREIGTNTADLSDLDTKAMTTIAQGVAAVVRRALDTAEVFQSFRDDDASPRAVLAQVFRGGVFRELSPQQQGGEPSVNASLCAGLCRCLELSKQHGAAAQLDTFALNVAEILDSYSTADNPDATLLYRWVGSAIRQVVGQKRSSKEWSRIARSATTAADTISGIWRTDSSRYEAETLLLSSKNDVNQEVPRCLNVFSIDGQRVCPVLLRLLYVLWFRGNTEVTRQHLLDSLLAHGYALQEVEQALSQAMSIDHRLIYSDIHDQFLGMNQWLKGPARVVRLSSAGMEYLQTLLAVPAYVQWALSGIAEVSESRAQIGGDVKTIRGRLLTARYGYELAIEKELHRIEERWKAHDGPNKANFIRCVELSVQSAPADIFFRALDPFMHVYRLNHNKFCVDRRNLAAAQEFADDAAGWVTLGRKTLDDHSRLFGSAVAAWVVHLRDAESDLQGMEVSRRVA